jgi:ABC-type multidrug transport system ATPase subunit
VVIDICLTVHHIGKSTLINIITGLVNPSHGKVFISGLDVEVDAAAVQQITGVCPQHDLLWPDLTAREHMYLVSAFKGSGQPSVCMMQRRFVLTYDARHRVGRSNEGCSRQGAGQGGIAG